MGECLRAIPPPPLAEAPLPPVAANEPQPADEALDNSEEEDLFGEEAPEFVPAPALEEDLIAAKIDQYDAQYEELYASSVCAKLTGDVTCDRQRQPRSCLTAFRECPHACITLSEAGTWGSAEQDWSDAGSIDEPASEDIIENSSEGEDISLEFDDDWAVQGGTTDPDLTPTDLHEAVEENYLGVRHGLRRALGQLGRWRL